MEQVLEWMGNGSFTLGVLITLCRVYLSEKDWGRIRGMPEGTTKEQSVRIAAMKHHLRTPIGHPGWQAAPMLIGFAVMFVCAVLQALVA